MIRVRRRSLNQVTKATGSKRKDSSFGVRIDKMKKRRRLLLSVLLAAISIVLFGALSTPRPEEQRIPSEQSALPTPSVMSPGATRPSDFTGAILTLLAVIIGGGISAGTAAWIHRLDRRADLAVSRRKEFYEPLLVSLNSARSRLQDPTLPSKVLFSVGLEAHHPRREELDLSWWPRFEAQGLALRMPDRLKQDFLSLMQTATMYEHAFQVAQKPVAQRLAEQDAEEARILEAYQASRDMEITRALSQLSGGRFQGLDLEDLPEAKEVWRLRDELTTQVDLLIVEVENHVASLISQYEAGRRTI